MSAPLDVSSHSPSGLREVSRRASYPRAAPHFPTKKVEYRVACLPRFSTMTWPIDASK
jgi:hypothetical protein